MDYTYTFWPNLLLILSTGTIKKFPLLDTMHRGPCSCSALQMER